MAGELRIETAHGPWYVRTEQADETYDNRVWFCVQAGPATFAAYIKRDDVLALAAKLLAAAGHDDPVDIPVGEATISDWATLEAAQ